MAITCPKCGAEFDATLFEFGHGVRCDCGTEIEYPGTDNIENGLQGRDEIVALAKQLSNLDIREAD